MPHTLTEPARQTPIWGEYDVVVLGGGPAGIAAAVAASRAGRSTLLIERYGFLGGMGTAAGVTNFCGLHANVHGNIRQVVHGVADDLLQRIDHLGGLNTPHNLFGKTVAQAYDTAAYKIAADDLLANAGVQVLFHALAAGVVMASPRTVHALLIETKSGRRAVVGSEHQGGRLDQQHQQHRQARPKVCRRLPGGKAPPAGCTDERKRTVA